MLGLFHKMSDDTELISLFYYLIQGFAFSSYLFLSFYFNFFLTGPSAQNWR